MPNFVGFKDEKIKEAHQHAKSCIERALNVAFNNNDLFQKRMSKYFASLTGQSSDVSSLVMKTINSMKIAIATNTYEVHLKPQPADQKTTTAECASWKQDSSLRGTTTDWVPQGLSPLPSGATAQLVNVLEAQLDYSGQKGPSIMSIYPAALKNKMWKMDEQCVVETYLHELSHVSAGTVDVTDNGIHPYGMKGVKACKMLGGRSAQNAENIAFFLSSFYK